MSTPTKAPLDSIETSEATTGRFFVDLEPGVAEGLHLPDEHPFQHAADFHGRYAELLPHPISKVLSGYITCEASQEVSQRTSFDQLVSLVVGQQLDASRPAGFQNGVQLSFAYAPEGLAYGWDVNIVSPRRLETPNARHTLQLYAARDRLAAFRGVRDSQGLFVRSEEVSPWCVYSVVHALTASGHLEAGAEELRKRQAHEKDALITLAEEQRQTEEHLLAGVTDRALIPPSIQSQLEKMAKAREEKIKRLREIGFMPAMVNGLMPPGYNTSATALPLSS